MGGGAEEKNNFLKLSRSIKIISHKNKLDSGIPKI